MTVLGPFWCFSPIWNKVPNSGPYWSACSGAWSHKLCQACPADQLYGTAQHGWGDNQLLVVINPTNTGLSFVTSKITTPNTLGHKPKIISTTSSADHTWLQPFPRWLRGWGDTEARHLVLMEKGGGGGDKVNKKYLVNWSWFCNKKIC